jgi:hypothetical protein
VADRVARRGFILPNVKVVIWPQNGQTVDAYQKDSIRLNNVAAREVLKLYSVLKKQHYLLAFFNKEDAINSLGEVQVGQWYPVEISGKTTSGKFFGGARESRSCVRNRFLPGEAAFHEKNDDEGR